MNELVKKSTEDIKEKLYNCLQSTFDEIDAVKHSLSCIYEGVANDLDILEVNHDDGSDSDFCEWPVYSTRITGNPHGGVWSVPLVAGFKYCPNCGKKLMMVSRC